MTAIFPYTSAKTGIEYRRFTHDPILPGLWIGSAPPPGRVLPLLGVDTLVLCAKECIVDQSPPEQYGVRNVVYAPFSDSGNRPTAAEFKAAEWAAEQVVDSVESRRRCLVTCFQGRNRSGLVCAIALQRMSGWSGKRAADWIRDRRDGALTNMYFYAYMIGKPGRRQVRRDR